jgi:hypothetical protein
VLSVEAVPVYWRAVADGMARVDFSVIVYIIVDKIYR